MIFTQIIRFKDLFFTINMSLHRYQYDEKILYEEMVKEIQIKMEEIESLTVESEILQNTFDADVKNKIKYKDLLTEILAELDNSLAESYNLELDNDGNPTGALEKKKFNYLAELESENTTKKKVLISMMYHRLNVLVMNYIRLTENYSEISEEPFTIEYKEEEKISFKEKFVYLKELGFFDLRQTIELSQNKKERVLSKILGCNIDYARDLIVNNVLKYGKDRKNGIREEMIEKVKNEINELKK